LDLTSGKFGILVILEFAEFAAQRRIDG